VQLNSSGNKRHVISAVGNISDTLHDFAITRRDTAIISAHCKCRAKLSSIGGPAEGWILDGVFQDIDITTGKLIFEWWAADHIPIANTLKTFENGRGGEGHPFNYFHINSVDQGLLGDYLVSAGNLRSVICIDGFTGRIRWNLGERANGFRDIAERPTVEFSWPHNARWIAHETLTVMDCGENMPHSLSKGNRSMTIDVSSHTKQAAVHQVYNKTIGLQKHPEGDLWTSRNTGAIFIGWGRDAGFSEFTANGETLCNVYFNEEHAHFSKQLVSSIIFKHSWIGKPLSKPIAKASGRTLYVHWNGATEVTEWQLQVETHAAKHDAPQYLEIGSYMKTGYETMLKLPRLEGSNHAFRIAALDREGNVLGYTENLKWQQAWTGSDLSHSQFQILAGVCLFGGLLTVLSTLHIRLKNRDKGMPLLPSYENIDWKTNKKRHL
jgi:Arylsulfotransferase (ASST)